MKEACLWKWFFSAIHLDVDEFLSQISFLLCIISTEQFFLTGFLGQRFSYFLRQPWKLRETPHWHETAYLPFCLLKRNFIHSIILLRYVNYNKLYIFKVYNLISFDIYIYSTHKTISISKIVQIPITLKSFLCLFKTPPYHSPPPQPK